MLYNESDQTNICSIYERRRLSQILYIILHSYTTCLRNLTYLIYRIHNLDNLPEPDRMKNRLTAALPVFVINIWKHNGIEMTPLQSPKPVFILTCHMGIRILTINKNTVPLLHAVLATIIVQLSSSIPPNI